MVLKLSTEIIYGSNCCGGGEHTINNLLPKPTSKRLDFVPEEEIERTQHDERQARTAHPVTKPAPRQTQISKEKEFKVLFASSEKGFRPARMQDDTEATIQVSHLPVDDGYLVVILEDGKPLSLAKEFTLCFTRKLIGSKQVSRNCFIDKEIGKEAFEQLIGNAIAQFTSAATAVA
ncbi:hypothetical protein FIU85_21865 (plasmid) [Roseovarius sp. THAF8]|uniref:hypothetical protein n=1 Tax=Roseovarius sp. THAF8 TaxID=2587846 RepID=UPI0012A9C555|nr:hypothetical protein [Roseovarius sp. THAF8]QFT99983.1 hypothetical protein FIU85_21865 [Roseovarius sp. THAF8]